MERREHRGTQRRLLVVEVGAERRGRQTRVHCPQGLQDLRREARTDVRRDDEAVVTARAEEESPRLREVVGDVDADPVGSELQQQWLHGSGIVEERQDVDAAIGGVGQGTP